MNSLALRWAVAEAYARLGQLDSAVALMELVVRPTRVPGTALALRGLTFPFAQRRLATWYAALARPAEARAHWRIFLDTVTSPDRDLEPMVAAARRAHDLL